MKPALASFCRLTRLLAVLIFFMPLSPPQAAAISNINATGSNIVGDHGALLANPPGRHHPQSLGEHLPQRRAAQQTQSGPDGFGRHRREPRQPQPEQRCHPRSEGPHRNGGRAIYGNVTIHAGCSGTLRIPKAL